MYGINTRKKVFGRLKSDGGSVENGYHEKQRRWETKRLETDIRNDREHAFDASKKIKNNNNNSKNLNNNNYNNNNKNNNKRSLWTLKWTEK